MNIDIISPFLFDIIIPFSLSLIITFAIIKNYNKKRNKEIIKHNLDIRMLQLEEQLKEQKEMSNLLMKQIEIILSRTSHANTILDNTNNLINTLNQTILNKNISHLHDVLVDQHHVSSKSNIMQSQIQTNNDYLSQSQKEDNDNNRHNSTVEYILKKIENNSLSTREIQKIIGRSREHTSRLMKKLYDNRFVERNINSKPFKYTITDEGRKLLIKHSASKNYHHVDVQKNIENLSDEMSAMTK